MLFATVQSGNTIAKNLRNSSRSADTQTQAPTTVASLLDILADDPPKAFPMLKTTCTHLSAFFNRPVAEILLDSVELEKDGFRRFLESGKRPRNSVRTYTNHARMLLNLAREHGWTPGDAVSERWSEVYELSKQQKCSKLVRHLARIRRTPNDVSIADVERWTQERVRQGSVYVYQRAVVRQFWRILQQCKCTTLSPDVMFRQERYGIPLKDFSSGLKAEVEGLLTWKQAASAAGRPKGARVRPVTAKSLELVISALVGFAAKVLGMTQIDSLKELVTEKVVGGFKDWCINTRRVKGQTVLQRLAHLFAAMGQHPSYASLDLNWFHRLLDGIEIETDTQREKRRQKHYLEYDVLASIPAQIRAAMQKSTKKAPRSLAMLAMTELLIRWLLVLPWRQRNLRECRIGGMEPNLYKSKIDPFSRVDKPDWVRRQELENPCSEYWMIRFSANETKTGNEPEMFLPRKLIAPLEEYIEKYRPVLAGAKDPETLFINSKGNPLSALEVTQLISQSTLRYGGRRVTPHLFRNIFVYTWLKAYPKDFLTVSKALWHRNIQTTIRIYGSKFDESTAVCAIESWLDEREATANQRNPRR